MLLALGILAIAAGLSLVTLTSSEGLASDWVLAGLAVCLTGFLLLAAAYGLS